MISDRSSDTEDSSNDAENSQEQITFTYKIYLHRKQLF